MRRVFVFYRKKTERSKKFFTDLMAKEHVPTMINPKPCGHLCCCAITGCEEVTSWASAALTCRKPDASAFTSYIISESGQMWTSVSKLLVSSFLFRSAGGTSFSSYSCPSVLFEHTPTSKQSAHSFSSNVQWLHKIWTVNQDGGHVSTSSYCPKVKPKYLRYESCHLVVCAEGGLLSVLPSAIIWRHLQVKGWS